MSDWFEGQLGDSIAALDAGVSVNAEDRPHGAGEIGVLKTSSVSGGVFIPEQNKTVVMRELRLVAEPVQGDSILVSRMNTPALVGESCYVRDPHPALFLPDRLWQLKPKDRAKISMRWLSFVLQSVAYRRYVEVHATGTSGSMKNLPKSKLFTLPVSYPAPSEQARIAEILDTLDYAIHETEAIIAKLKAIKQGLLHDLLSRGIDANGGLRPPQTEAPHLYRESPLGWIPRDWEAITLSACALKIADRDHTTPRYVEDGVLIVSPTNLVGDEGIDFASSKRITRRAHEINRKKTDLAPGDIILHRIGAGLGRVRLVSAEMPEFSILHSMAQIRPNLNVITSHFMLWAMRTESTKSQMGLGTQSIGVPDLGLDKISNFIVPKPQLEEQREIAARLAALQTRIDADSDDYAKLATLKTGLMDDLLTGRVRVKTLVAEVAKQQGSA